MFCTAALVACDDTPEGAPDEVTCGPGEVRVDERCRPVRPPEPDVDEAPDIGPGEPDGAADGDDDADVDEEDDVFDPGSSVAFPIDERAIADCGEGEPGTRVTGRVTIPSGALPLPGVTVYVPRDPPARIRNGASCEPCGRSLSGRPLVDTVSGIDGTFTLRDVPHGTNVPLVIEVGKWRRMVAVPSVTACEVTEIDLDLTRLPRNQSEGNIPQFAVTTGGFDSLECLLRKIGIDDEEFTPSSIDGRVHLFAGQGGTERFAPTLHGGASFVRAWDWWGDILNLLPYDIILHSCEGNEYGNRKPAEATDALMRYTNAGGRVFLSHYHYYWLMAGPEPFRAVADWGLNFSPSSNTETGIIDTSFAKGAELASWMEEIGAAVDDMFPITDVRASMRSFNGSVATQWVTIEPTCDPLIAASFPALCGDGGEAVQYFSFNTPVGVGPEAQCGRVVFSDIHVAGGDTSSPTTPFPNGCVTSSFTPQEQAIIFMLFDLSRCIIPDKI